MAAEPARAPDPTSAPVPAAGVPVAPAVAAQSPAPDVALMPGTILDDFALVERLHQGGMATLWGVRRVSGDGSGDPPAMLMKVPRIKGGEDPATIVGFEVEQMILPVVRGPHVPRYVARGDFTRQAYIVMERIEGETLRPRLDEAPLSLSDLCEIGERVASALHALHRQHVVHLDVKPSNILFRANGEAVLVDFGLSWHAHLPDLLDEEFTLPMGTGPYMSPEQVQFVRSDPRSDLFALGVMLYHLATGQRPFGSPTSVRGLRRRLFVEPRPPRAIRPDLPPWFQEIVLRCLEVDPARRYQSGAQLAADLREPGQVALTDRASRMQTTGWLRRMRRWWTAVGHEPEKQTVLTGHAVHRSPTIVAAIDVDGAEPRLLELLRATVLRLVQTEPGARLACIGVMKTARVGMDRLTDEHGRSLHVQQLVALKHWARPLGQALGFAEGQLTFHVLEAPDPAVAIIEFASRNQVDHVVMGARANSAMRRYLGSVSSEVVAKADCSVTVVRAAGRS